MSSLKNPNKSQVDNLIKKNKSVRGISVDDLFDGIKKGDKNTLGKAITLLESSRKEDFDSSRKLVSLCLPLSGNAIRIGITGVPGVGKSTFIESFGEYLIKLGKKVAVLAIDPSSEKTKGSILGDKTRMNLLSSNPNAFIRPTASGGSLGGVANHTRESILVCEAAGYDVIIIETVGVGQSETVVRSMTDVFLLLMLAGAGDELQGIKRGIMEMADIILINKADGDNVDKAKLAKAQYSNAIHLFPPNENNWIPKTETVSAIENKNIDVVWKHIEDYKNMTNLSGWLDKNRKKQQVYWMKEIIQDRLLQEFYENRIVLKKISSVLKEVEEGSLSSFDGALKLFNVFKND